MQYVDAKKKVMLYTTKKNGDGQLEKEPSFMYGRILHFDYEDMDSENLLVMIDCLRGVRKVFLSEDRLVKESRGPESFRKDLETTTSNCHIETIYLGPCNSKGTFSISGQGPEKEI